MYAPLPPAPDRNVRTFTYLRFSAACASPTFSLELSCNLAEFKLFRLNCRAHSPNLRRNLCLRLLAADVVQTRRFDDEADVFASLPPAPYRRFRSRCCKRDIYVLPTPQLAAPGCRLPARRVYMRTPAWPTRVPAYLRAFRRNDDEAPTTTTRQRRNDDDDNATTRQRRDDNETTTSARRRRDDATTTTRRRRDDDATRMRYRRR